MNLFTDLSKGLKISHGPGLNKEMSQATIRGSSIPDRGLEGTWQKFPGTRKRADR